MVRQSLDKHVEKNEKGWVVGLLVRQMHAEKFIAPDPHRKVYEIRTRPVKFFSEGAKVALVSMEQSRRRCRKVLGILEFVGNIKIRTASFDKYHALHQVSQDEFKSLDKAYQNAEYLWAWNFELVEAFQTAPEVAVTTPSGAMVWFYFPSAAVGSLKDGILVRHSNRSFMLSSRTKNRAKRFYIHVYVCLPWVCKYIYMYGNIFHIYIYLFLHSNGNVGDVYRYIHIYI